MYLIKRFLILRSFILFSILIFSACGDDEFPGCKSSVVINFSSELNIQRTLIPPISMEIAYYDIIATGPDGALFTSFNVTGSCVLIEDLVPGEWVITATARNFQGTAIGAGSVSVVLKPGRTALVNIVILPFEGTGVLSLEMNWTDSISDPQVNASLAPSTGTPDTLPFNISGDSAFYTNFNLNAGYYTLSIQLKDGPIVVWGVSDVVRIIAGQITSGIYNSWDTSKLGIIIFNDLQNPIDIILSGGETNISAGNDMTITADTSQIVESYQWHLNGVSITGETGSTITIGNSLPAGVHTLSLIVKKGVILSSIMFVFEVF